MGERAHVFDMDGTLLLGTTAPLLLAEALGATESLLVLEERFAAGTASAVDFDAVFASRFPADADTPLDETAILNPRDKPRLAGAFCAEDGLRLDQAVAYGDSMSDVFLFEQTGLRVSVNGDHHIEQLADITISGPDLLAAYTAVRERLAS
jgi:phosphoserine phosphatase